MRKYLVQAIAFSVYAVFSISWFVVSVLTPEIGKELNISTSQSVLITNAIVFAKIFGAMFAGLLIYKYGLRIGYFLGCLFISGGILMGYVDKITFIEPFYVIILSRFLSGLGSAVALAALVPIAQKYFAQSKNLSTVITINMNSNVVGSLIAFLFATEIVAYFNKDWKSAMVFFSYVNLALVLLWLFLDKKDEKPVLGDKEKGFAIIGSLLKNKVLWAMVIYYIGPLIFLNSTSLHLILYIKKELVAAGIFTQEKALEISRIFPSIICVVCVVSPFLGNYLKKKGYDRVKILSSVSLGLILCIGLYLLKNEYALYAAAVLGGALFGLVVPYLFSMPAEFLKDKPEFSGYVVSAFWSISFAILFINNQILAYIYDVSKSYFYGFIYLILLLLVTPLSLRLVSSKEKK